MMKKLLIFSLATVCLYFFGTSQQALAQGWYVLAKGGYHFDVVTDRIISPNDLIGESDLMVDSTGIVSDKAIFGAAGDGWSTSFGAGYMFSEHIGVEMQAYYAKGVEQLDSRMDIPNYFAEQRSDRYRVGVIPALVISTGSNDLVSAYAKAGLELPVAGGINSTVTINDEAGVITDVIGNLILGDTELNLPPTTTNITGKATTEGDISYGLHSTFGVRFGLGDYLSVFGEVTYALLSIRGKETRFSELDIEADPLVLGVLNTFGFDSPEDIRYAVDINYVDEITHESNNAAYNSDTDLTKPIDRLRLKQTYNNIGLHVGVKYEF